MSLKKKIFKMKRVFNEINTINEEIEKELLKVKAMLSNCQK